MLVGLTGGIGSGKTTVSDVFSEIGVPIIDTDIIARDVLELQPQLLDELSIAFGKSIINVDQSLNREELREIAFSSKSNKAKLDSIMHPAIRKQTLAKIEQQTDKDYCIVVVPLLIETNFKTLVDRILVITAPQERKLIWLKKRSGLKANEAQAIIDSQTSDEERLVYAHDHIVNDKDIDDIKKQVQELHEKYLAIAND